MDRIRITGFNSAPPFAHGLVRDLRVRWALEEAGLAYDVSLLDADARKSADYRSWQPFGQVPAFEADGMSLFESGAILFRIAEESEALMPAERESRLDTLAWMFAALNTVEPRVDELFAIDQLHPGEEWARLRRPAAVSAVESRLAVLSDRLAGREHLGGRFTAADILMVTVLRLIRHTDLVSRFPAVEAYVRRCEARPAFEAAEARQVADYTPVAA